MKKRVMLVGGGIQEARAVERAKELGYSILVTSKDIHSPAFEHADVSVVCDGRDIEKLIEVAHRYRIDAAFTFTELVTSVAIVNHALELGGAGIYPTVCCQNKWLAYQCFESLGIPTPYTEKIERIKQIRRFLKDNDNEAFVKPIVGYGGIGAERITELWQPIYKGNYIIQEYLEGTHHDANGLMDRFGNDYVLGITDRKFDGSQEIEIRAPTELDERRQAELYDLLFMAARAVGIQEGPVKCDVMLVNGEFKILEIAPRLHGPKATLYALPAVGIEPLELMLQCITGQVIDGIQEPNGRAVMTNKGNDYWVMESSGGFVTHCDFGGQYGGRAL